MVAMVMAEGWLVNPVAGRREERQACLGAAAYCHRSPYYILRLTEVHLLDGGAGG
ncbi:MAG TPA: hypothetical protein VK850_19135 [Candidatus Binatia bacterium]|nr:hypothetical protein [Candidatus Binatia bacterium]